MVRRNTNEQIADTKIADSRKRKPDWSSVVGTGPMNINFNIWSTILYILLGIIFLPIYLFDYVKEKIDE